MRKGIRIITVMLSGLLFAASQASAVDLTTGDTGGGDGNLNENIPDTPVDNTTLSIRSRLVGGTERHSLAVLRFGIGGLSTETVTNATLKLNVTAGDANDSFSIDVFGLVDGTTKGSYDDALWPETAVTYNNMPGISGADYPNIDRDHVAGETVLLGSINYTVGTTGTIQMDSTQALIDFINADANGYVTFILEPEVATVVNEDFSVTVSANKGNEAAVQPTLTVETMPYQFSSNSVAINGHTDGQNATLNEFAPTTPTDVSNYVSVRRRYVDGSERNNVGVFQFDISSMSSAVLDAGFSVSLYQVTAASTEIRVYGLNENASKGGVTEANWDRSTITYNTMPGLEDSDGDCQTSDLIASNVTYLGSIAVPGASPIGTEFLFRSDALVDFINDDSNESITLILETRNVVSGRDEDAQFISAHRSSSGSGTYPTLTLDPAPPSTVVITLGQLSETGLPLSWESFSGIDYVVESTTNLLDGTWTTNQSGIAGTGGNITVTTAVDQASAFFRIIGN